ncbi:MAG: hypothetical protein KGJ35_01150 [Patescibacteria group bacterium]|nr:hypothetical protein [Patescibacteria group bacterium]
MKKKTDFIFPFFLFLFPFSFLLFPFITSAHEVYVLSPQNITTAIDTPSFNMFAVAMQNANQFSLWTFIVVLAIIVVFATSIMRWLERRLDPFLARLRPYAPFVGRLTFGLSFLAAAYYGALCGPELSLTSLFGPYTPLITAMIAIIGIMIIFGLYTRLATAVALGIFSVAVWTHGWYMLTYTNYVGEIFVLLILGSHRLSLDRLFTRHTNNSGAAHYLTTPPPSPHIWRNTFATFHFYFHRIVAWLAPRSFAILRVAFGIALIYASTYAKIIHNNLALMTVEQYHLDKILGFEPHFLVLGAALIELLIGLFFIFGIEIRFTALFFEFWLILSLCFFGEAVWPHIILIGIPIALFMHGYDRYSIEGWLFRKKKYPPVL